MTPRMRVSKREDLVHLVKPNSVCAEVGVFFGDFAKKILTILPSKLYLIDTWADDYKLTMFYDGSAIEKTGSDAFASVQQTFGSLPNVEILRGNSCDMLRSLPVNSLDMVYIDADHSYWSVLGELSESFGRVKNGGWIMGHDYCPAMPGVIDAVHEFCRQYQLRLDVLTDEDEMPVIGVPGMHSTKYESYGIRVRK